MTELGLRYRPLATADQEAHAAQVALLAKDLSDVNPSRLEQAASAWANRERFMPKAAELRALMRTLNSETSPTDPQECCDWANARLHPKAVEANLHWIVTGDPAKPIELRKYGA